MSTAIRIGMVVQDRFGIVGEVVDLRTFDGEACAIMEQECGRLFERAVTELEQMKR